VFLVEPNSNHGMRMCIIFFPGQWAAPTNWRTSSRSVMGATPPTTQIWRQYWLDGRWKGGLSGLRDGSTATRAHFLSQGVVLLPGARGAPDRL
jgi:hypothetical protein